MATMREEVYHKLHPMLESLVDIACDNIEKLEKDNEWISVKDGLPETDDDVMVTYWDRDDHDFRDIAISSYREVRFGGRGLGYKDWLSPSEYFKHNYEVIAWKPKPELYDGD